MQFSNLILASILSVALAAPTAQGPGYVSVPVKHRKVTPGAGNQLTKRGAYSEPLQNQILQYIAEIQIGTPAQNVEASIDTGSSDLWVYSQSAGVSGEGTFDSSSSSTYKDLKEKFSIQYVSGSASGEFVSDVVSVAGASVKAQQFATVGNNAGSSTGVFGVGFTGDESTTKEYSNFPASLKASGVIGTNAYSLFLDDLDANSGSIIFGGSDTDKYTGSLVTVPFTSDTAFSVTTSVEGHGSSFDGILDAGTSLTYVPQSVVSSIAKTLGAKFNNQEGAYFLSALPTQSITYKFGSATVTVPPSELAIPASDLGVNSDEYILTIFPNSQSQGFNLLGDSFLRSAYVTYDLDNGEASIGQASYSSSSNIVAL